MINSHSEANLQQKSVVKG
jgi:hypothetical protein